MKKALTAMVVLAALITGGLLWAGPLLLGRGPTPVEAISEVVPNTVVYYAEADDLAGALAGARDTLAFRELQESVIWLDEDGPVQELLATLDSVATKIDYPLDDGNLMKFLGRSVAVGVALDAKLKKPVTLVATRLDMDALGKDLLSGDFDWRGLEAELNARTERAEFELVSREQRGYTVTTARKGETIVYWTVFEDVLVVSDSRILLDASVDARVDGTGSLAQLQSFVSEVARLEGDRTAFDWTHFAAISEQRDLARTCWEPVGDWYFDPLLDAVDAPSLARAYDVPGGDLYEARWWYSRPAADIFRDDASHPLLGIAGADAGFYMEGRNLGEVVRAFEGSAVEAALEESPLAEKMSDMLADPTAMLAKMGSFSPGLPADVGPHSVVFPATFAANAMRRGVESVFAGDVALSMSSISLDGQDVRFAVAARLGIDGRFAALIASADPSWRSFGRVGDRTLYGNAGDAFDGCWALVGDAVVLGNDFDQTSKAVTALTSATEGAPTAGALGEALGRLPQDAHYYYFVDTDVLTDGTLDEMIDLPFKLSDLWGMRYSAYSVRVADDFSKVEFQAHAPLRDGATELAQALLLNRRMGASQVLEIGPKDTLVSMAMNYDASEALRLFRDFSVKMELVEPKEIEEGLGAADEFLGMSLERDLLPALKGEYGMVVVAEHESADEQTPPIPGLAVLIGVVDRAPVEKALTRVADAIGEQMEKQAARGGPPQRLVIERAGSGKLYRLDMAGEVGPLEPTYGLVGDFLVLGSSPKIVGQLAAGLNQQEAAGWTAQERIARAKAALPAEYNAFVLMDNAALMKQLEVYVDFGSRVASQVPQPQFPDNGNMDEWERRVAEYEKQVEAESRDTSDILRAVLRTLAIMETSTSWSRVEGDTAISGAVIEFKR